MQCGWYGCCWFDDLAVGGGDVAVACWRRVKCQVTATIEATTRQVGREEKRWVTPGHNKPSQTQARQVRRLGNQANACLLAVVADGHQPLVCPLCVLQPLFCTNEDAPSTYFTRQLSAESYWRRLRLATALLPRRSGASDTTAISEVIHRDVQTTQCC